MDPLEQSPMKIWSDIHIYFIQENAFENVVCQMATILSRLQCVNVAGLEVYKQ